MMDAIAITFISLLWFCLGYVVGNLNGNKKDILEFVYETGKTIYIEAKKLVNPRPTIPTGRIKPVTAQEAYNRSMDPKRKEALEEDKRQMDANPELVRAKELAAQMKYE